MTQDEDSLLGGRPAIGWAGLRGNWETGIWPYTGLESERKSQSGTVIMSHFIFN